MSELYRLGAKPPRQDPRTLQFSDYIRPAVILPAVPGSHDWTPLVAGWPMYGNDRLGDCTLAAAGHMIQSWTAAAGAPATPDENGVVTAYWETGVPPSTSGSPGGPTDDGRVELDVLNYWRNTGVGADRIKAYVQIDPANIAHLRAAIWIFGGVYTGVALPLSAQGKTRWTYSRGPNGKAGSWGGHAIPYLAYTPRCFKCVTWGSPLELTLGFHLHYCQEAYAILSEDFLAAGRSPAGFDIDALTNDLAAL